VTTTIIIFIIIPGENAGPSFNNTKYTHTPLKAQVFSLLIIIHDDIVCMLCLAFFDFAPVRCQEPLALSSLKSYS